MRRSSHSPSLAARTDSALVDEIPNRAPLQGFHRRRRDRADRGLPGPLPQPDEEFDGTRNAPHPPVSDRRCRLFDLGLRGRPGREPGAAHRDGPPSDRHRRPAAAADAHGRLLGREVRRRARCAVLRRPAVRQRARRPREPRRVLPRELQRRLQLLSGADPVDGPGRLSRGRHPRPDRSRTIPPRRSTSRPTPTGAPTRQASAAGPTGRSRPAATCSCAPCRPGSRSGTSTTTTTVA